MSQPTLTLSEHELYFLPSGTLATAPATRVEVEVDGEMRVFLARLELSDQAAKQHRSYLFCKEESLDDSGVLIGELGKNPKELSSETENSDFISYAMKSYPKARCWRPINPMVGVMVFPWNNAAIYWREQQFLSKPIPFRWENNATSTSMLDWTPQEFTEFSQSQFTRENPLFRYALEWKELGQIQRDYVAFGCQQGNWSQLRRLLSLTQIVVTHNCGIFPDGRRAESHWMFDLEWRHPQPSIAVLWAQRWRSAICDIMRPSFWQDEHLCVHHWRHQDPNDTRCKIRCGIPTHHEFLEAQLELREFLCSHLSDHEIEALMRPEPIA